MTTSYEEIIHGVPISDRYRWLEDRSLPETGAWIRDQQRACDAYFNECPELHLLENRVRAYLDVVVIDQPARIGKRYVYRKRSVGKEQGCLCVRQMETGEERVLVDPAADGSFASVNLYSLEQSGNFLAYRFGQGGGDHREIRIADMTTGVVLPDKVPGGYSRGFAFVPGGFVYSQDTDPSSTSHDIRYHSLGSCEEDVSVLRVPREPGSTLVLQADTHRLGALWVRPNGNELIADLFISSVSDPTAWSTVYIGWQMPCLPYLADGRIFVHRRTKTNNSCVIELSESGEELRTVIPETAVPIQQLLFSNGKIFLGYRKQNAPHIDCWSLEGTSLSSFHLPHCATAELLPIYGQSSTSVFYSIESFDTPPTIYEYATETGATTVWHKPDTPRKLQKHKMQEFEACSKDGTLIPLTVVFSAQNVVSGPLPIIMTSYGGFGVSMTPRFSVLVEIMVELGAAFVLPRIRGGGDFGKAWHDAGRGRKRQAAFDDFIACAQWLCENQFTTPKQLAIFGGSNSGLLIGVAMTQHPELFGAVLCIAPLLDMLRYEQFDRALKWRKEYGTVEDPDDFRVLSAYSPYHHVSESTDYPPAMFVSGDKDDRCNPAHVRKMVALLRNRPAQKNPVIVDYTEERGHSPVLPLSVRIAALTRRIAFLCRELQIAILEGDPE